ncbi:MAG: nucleotidyltransferase family protein [Candidatus Promineifilaceae bacterium]
MSLGSLSPEESFLWQCARTWRRPQLAGDYLGRLDWRRVIETARHNKMQTLLHVALTTTGCLDELPQESQRELTQDAEKMAKTADGYAAALTDYLERASAEHILTVVLKGLFISQNFYQQVAMRPGGDIDLLVKSADVHPSLAVLEAMGNYRWHKLLDDRYYEHHHLHQIRGRLDTRIWFEVHWALDHPYTLLTIDYEAMLNRAMPGVLLGQPVYELAPPDQLLSQVVHLVKHAVYLPATVGRTDIPRIVLADGMLMYYLDVTETLRHYGGLLDWSETIRLARAWGAADMLGAVLRVCSQYLDAPVPQHVLAELPVEKPGRVTAYVMNRMADYEVTRHMGQTPSRLWSFLVGYKESLVLRPIRLLDAFAYLFPPTDYLQRRYGRSSLPIRLQHTLKAAGQYLRNLVDSLYYTWDYHRRLKKEDIAHGFIKPQ